MYPPPLQAGHALAYASKRHDGTAGREARNAADIGGPAPSQVLSVTNTATPHTPYMSGTGMTTSSLSAILASTLKTSNQPPPPESARSRPEQHVVVELQGLHQPRPGDTHRLRCGLRAGLCSVVQPWARQCGWAVRDLGGGVDVDRSRGGGDTDGRTDGGTECGGLLQVPVVVSCSFLAVDLPSVRARCAPGARFLWYGSHPGPRT